jgi:nucleoside-diphosphate-sugar epimerase
VRALVTGDRGFLGRHFRAELEARGWDVHGCDNDDAGPEVTDCRNLFQYWDTAWMAPGAPHIDLVVHCAAVVGGRATIDGSPLETAVNLELDAAMFRWAARAKPGRVLYISSSAAYPVENQTESAARFRLHSIDPYGLRLSESDLLAPYGSGHPSGTRPVHTPDQVYGWSKVMGEVLAARLREAGVPVTVVRPFSGYGHDQSPDYPFRAFLDRAVRREDPFRLWCGDCTRDFIHVDDLVKGALAVVESGTERPVNLATGRGTSFLELAAMVCDAVGYAPEIIPDPAAPAGVAYRVGDPEWLHQIYVPAVDLELGIRRSLDQMGVAT